MADSDRIDHRTARFAEQLTVESNPDPDLQDSRRVVLDGDQVGRVRFTEDGVDGVGWLVEVWNGTDDFESFDFIFDLGRRLERDEVDRQTVGAVAAALAEGIATPKRRS